MSDKLEELSVRRKHPRYNLSEPINITDRFSENSLGVLANISLDGLMIAGRYPMETDTIYQIIMTLPNVIDGKQTIEVGVDCLWTNANSENAGMHWSGCQIIDYSDNDITMLEHIIEQLAID